MLTFLTYIEKKIKYEMIVSRQVIEEETKHDTIATSAFTSLYLEFLPMVYHVFLVFHFLVTFSSFLLKFVRFPLGLVRLY